MTAIAFIYMETLLKKKEILESDIIIDCIFLIEINEIIRGTLFIVRNFYPNRVFNFIGVKGCIDYFNSLLLVWRWTFLVEKYKIIYKEIVNERTKHKEKFRI